MRLVEQEPGDRTSLTVRVHVWPRTDILEVSATGSDTFFIAPCDIYMPEVDYQSILQGVLMAAYPDAAAQEIERRSRWIWFNERYVVGTPLERAAFP
jgi:hypothetical protein